MSTAAPLATASSAFMVTERPQLVAAASSPRIYAKVVLTHTMRVLPPKISIEARSEELIPVSANSL